MTAAVIPAQAGIHDPNPSHISDYDAGTEKKMQKEYF